MLEPYYFYPYFRLKMPPHTLWKNNILEQLTKQNEEEFYEILPKILIEAQEKIDKIYNDILKL